VWLHILQWGIAVMIAAGSIIFYARQAIKADLMTANVLKAGQPLPVHIYLVGTAFLCLLAFIFTVLSGLASRRYRSYFDQLIRSTQSGVDDITATGYSRWIMPSIFWAFPGFDFLLRIYNYEIAFFPDLH
jgi:hypothetical protein